MLDIERDRRKTLKKKERKTKNEKKSNNNNNIFSLLFFYIEKFIFYQKKYLDKLSFYCYICIRVFFAWQFIGNALIKQQHPHRYAMVSYTSYFDPKYLAIG